MAKIKKSQDSPKRQSQYNLDIAVYNSQKIISLSQSSVKKMVKGLLDHFQLKTEGLAVHFVTKNRISHLHHQFFNDPTPTDCITFPIDPHFLGEIFICPEVAIEYASRKKIDPYVELSRYLIHSFLHLLGFDDQDSQSKRKMRQKENQFLKLLKEQGLILK
ncbi:MAG TPA: rRNA maturation RNase YbeY [Rhabdochlamydiaceae bacterium]|nr:rRNA maturation RNase YbeY [Rhabdochlamydiaceae bacterium]